MSSMSMSDLYSYLNHIRKNELILDVRGRDEFAEGHVPGSRNIPHDEVGQHVQELSKFEKIYIHCRSGKRAQVARDVLEKSGLTNVVCISSGGMLNWEEAGYPVEK